MPIELVATAKILGLNVSSDWKWNSHIDSIIKKAQKCLYSLSQLKSSGLGTRGLVQFFCTCIRPYTEYTCPVFRDSLPVYLSNEPERVQKRAMRIIFPFCSYNGSLVQLNVIKLLDRCQELVDKPFKEVVQSKTEYAPRPSPCSLGRTSETHGNLGQFSRRTDSVLVLLRPTPSKLKLCSRSIVLEVSIAFYHVDFVFYLLFFLTNHNFTVVYSCTVSPIGY